MTYDQSIKLNAKYDAIIEQIDNTPICREYKIKIIDALDEMVTAIIEEFGESMDFSKGGD